MYYNNRGSENILWTNNDMFNRTIQIYILVITFCKWNEQKKTLCFDYNQYITYHFNHLHTTSNFSILSLTVGSRDNFRDFDMCLCLDDSLDVTVVKGSEVDVMLPWTGDGSTEYKDDVLLLIFPAIKIHQFEI